MQRSEQNGWCLGRSKAAGQERGQKLAESGGQGLSWVWGLEMVSKGFFPFSL